MIIDELASSHSFKKISFKTKAEVFEKTFAGEKVYLIKPTSFMNNSGVPVREVANFYKITPENVFVFYDELDLETGKIRIKLGGSSAGHNGIKSIDENLGKNYHRIRIGISHPGHKDLVSSYVLSRFRKEELEVIEKVIIGISQNIDELVNKKPDSFMSKVSTFVNPPKPKVKKEPVKKEEKNGV